MYMIYKAQKRMLFALMTLWAMQDECEDNRAPRPIQYYVNNTQQLVGFMFAKQTGAGVCVQRRKKSSIYCYYHAISECSCAAWTICLPYAAKQQIVIL